MEENYVARTQQWFHRHFYQLTYSHGAPGMRKITLKGVLLAQMPGGSKKSEEIDRDSGTRKSVTSPKMDSTVPGTRALYVNGDILLPLGF